MRALIRRLFCAATPLSAAGHRIWPPPEPGSFWFVSFLALADPLMQTLHDRSAGTVVIKDPPPVPRHAPRSERMEFETTDEA